MMNLKRYSNRSDLLLLFFSYILFTTAPLTLHAEPLEKWDCKKFDEERVRLEQAGIKAKMRRGPVWAEKNLDPSTLEQIRQFMIVTEQLKFRCPAKPLKKKQKQTMKKKKRNKRIVKKGKN